MAHAGPLQERRYQRVSDVTIVDVIGPPRAILAGFFFANPAEA
ncbi:MAG: hypothetical protein JWR25_1157 [Noviherbaspirillum sp.]|jgi:hypothetical protein|nr:hypothetical protein [Noviherbaspirillum sp.]